MVQILPPIPTFGSRLAEALGGAATSAIQGYQQRQTKLNDERHLQALTDPNLTPMQQVSLISKLSKPVQENVSRLYSPLIKQRAEQEQENSLLNQLGLRSPLQQAMQQPQGAGPGEGAPAQGQPGIQNLSDDQLKAMLLVPKYKAFAENELNSREQQRENDLKLREKAEKTTKEQKAVKELLRETGKFKTEEELDEAAMTYDLQTAKTIWKEAKKAPPKSAAQKMIEEEAAKGYIAAKNEVPKLQATLENIGRLRELGGKLRGIGGYAKAALKTQSAAEYNTLSASLLDPIIKVFNPVGAVPVTKLNWIRETFAPQASDLASTQEGKLATLERLASQAQQRAQEKIKLFNDYNGEPPESEVMKFDNESTKMMTDFVDNQQYIDKLKKEVPKGKVLMLDDQGKPLHVDPNMTMPNGMTALEYAKKFGARVAE